MNPTPPARRTWLIIFAALSATVFVYGLLAYLIEHNPQSHRTVNPASVATMRPLLILLALGMLGASVAWLRFRVDGKIGEDGRELLLTPGQFQTDSIVSLALSEACTIYGLLLFFLGAPLREYALFGLGTLLVNFAFILPRGLAFWAAWEKQAAAGDNPLNPMP